MQIQNRCKSIFRLLLKVVMLTTALLIAIVAAMSGWYASYAQVTDWCSQSPMPIWCTSHEEVINGNPVFTYTNNIPTGSNINGQSMGWFSATNGINGGALDRNDYNTTGVTRTYFYTSLPAIVTEASVSIPARSGETNSKRFVSLSSNRSTFSTALVPADKSVGVFLSRKTKGGATDYTTGVYSNGLYFSAWYYFPQVYSSTTTSNDTLMVMEFMSEVSSGNWKLPWSIHLKKKTNGQMAYRVDERSASFSSDPTIADDLIQHFDQSSLDVPIDRWTHLEVFYKYATLTGTSGPTDSKTGLGNGQVIVFQDGMEIFRFDSVATQGTNSLTDLWLVASYSYLTTPAPFQFYVDDAAISTVRLGGARELISNGDFETLANWRIDDDTLATDSLENAGMSANSPSAAKLARNIGANPTALYDPSFYQTVAGGLSQGATYTLRFSAKAATAPRTIQALLLENSYPCCGGSGNDQWTEYWNDSCGVVSLDTTLQNYVCTFTAAYASNSVNLVFRLGGSHNTIWLDNVSLVQNDNLLRNGDFSDTTTAPWTFNLNGASASTGIDNNGGLAANNPKAMAITVTAALTDVWKPELYQVIQGGLDKDITYTLRFTGKVNISSRAIRVVVQSNESPYSFLWSGSCGQVTLTSAAQNFVCAVTLPAATTNARLNFLLGGSGSSHTVWIDNVSLSRSQ